MAEATDHQRTVRQAMEGNLAAYFHPTNDLIAFLYPNGNIHVFNSQTWEQTDQITANKFDEDGNLIEGVELIKRGDMKMHARGFDRQGRVQGADFQ